MGEEWEARADWEGGWDLYFGDQHVLWVSGENGVAIPRTVVSVLNELSVCPVIDGEVQ